MCALTPKVTELETDRLHLRQWLPSDYAPFAVLNADPEVMACYPRPLTESESHAFARKSETLLRERGWGFWALELKTDNRFIGFVGLHNPEANLPCTPCVEISWRLAKEHWGNGYATEAARAALAFAFNTLCLDEVVAFTSVQNRRSRLVMERLAMIDTKQNFEHPRIPIGHRLREHVLYKITKFQWEQSAV